MRPEIGLLVALGQYTQLCRSAETEWPYNLPPHVKYYPEDEPIVRRNVDIQKRFAAAQPSAVRKMSEDAGEMFFFEYWDFGDENKQESENISFGNGTEFTPAMRLHDAALGLSPRWYQRRSFTCPSGTNACSGIDRPNSCCPQGLICHIIPDSGLGDVGCCQSSDSCGGQSSSCPVDYTACPAQAGGGCCIPGYACEGVGCVLTSTTVVVVTPEPPATPTPSSSSRPSTSSRSPVSTSAAPTTSAPPPPPPVATCSSGFQSCPASQGGGCCPTDRECGPRTCPPSSTPTPSPSSSPSTTPSEAPPVRPTSDPDPETPSSTPAPTSATPTACPNNFYACSAYYPGAGCCQGGRDCASTSCPGRETSSVIVSNGVTIVAEPTTGACASDWISCPATVGGGCCPSGYACGSESCSATVLESGSPTGVAKQGAASRIHGGMGMIGLICGAWGSIWTLASIL